MGISILCMESWFEYWAMVGHYNDKMTVRPLIFIMGISIPVRGYIYMFTWVPAGHIQQGSFHYKKFPWEAIMHSLPSVTHTVYRNVLLFSFVLLYHTSLGIHTTLEWRHNGWDVVSNHQSHDCLLNRLFSRRSKKTSKLRVAGLCEGNSPVRWPVNSPHKGPVTWKMFPFDDVIMIYLTYLYGRFHWHSGNRSISQIPWCAIQNRKVHISVLNGAL